MKSIQFIFLGSTVLLLCGCASREDLGIDSSTWHSLPSKQKSSYKSNYYKIKRQLKHSIGSSDTTDNNNGFHTIHINIQYAKAFMPPLFSHAISITPIEYTLNIGECRKIALTAGHSKLHTTLYTCYKNQLLSFDPSHYVLNQSRGTLFIHNNPAWDPGYTYTKLMSKGYTRLRDAIIRVYSKTPLAYTPNDATVIPNAMSPINQVKKIKKETLTQNSNADSSAKKSQKPILTQTVSTLKNTDEIPVS